jgi:integrase
MDDIELEAEGIGSPVVVGYPGAEHDATQLAAIERAANERAQDFYERATGKRAKLSDHIDAWATAAVKAEDYTARTADLGKSVVRGFCGKKELPEFTRQKLQAYINTLVDSGRSASTIKKYLGYLASFWKYLQRIDVAPFEVKPFDGLQRPKKKNGSRKRENFPKADIPKLFKASEGTQLHTLIQLAAYTGCRIEELCSLKIANVHDRAAIPYLHIEDGKNENATRDVPIHAAILPLVRTLKHNSAKVGDEYLFVGLTADKYGDRSHEMSKAFTALKTELGYDDRYTFHSIRHTFVTELDEAEVSETTRKFIVGHAADKSAVKGYLHPRSLAKKAEAIAKITYDAVQEYPGAKRID